MGASTSDARAENTVEEAESSYPSSIKEDSSLEFATQDLILEDDPKYNFSTQDTHTTYSSEVKFMIKVLFPDDVCKLIGGYIDVFLNKMHHIIKLPEDFSRTMTLIGYFRNDLIFSDGNIIAILDARNADPQDYVKYTLNDKAHDFFCVTEYPAVIQKCMVTPKGIVNFSLSEIQFIDTTRHLTMWCTNGYVFVWNTTNQRIISSKGDFGVIDREENHLFVFSKSSYPQWRIIPLAASYIEVKENKNVVKSDPSKYSYLHIEKNPCCSYKDHLFAFVSSKFSLESYDVLKQENGILSRSSGIKSFATNGEYLVLHRNDATLEFLI